jgi:hypothetical protein
LPTKFIYTTRSTPRLCYNIHKRWWKWAMRSGSRSTIQTVNS